MVVLSRLNETKLGRGAPPGGLSLRCSTPQILQINCSFPVELFGGKGSRSPQSQWSPGSVALQREGEVVIGRAIASWAGLRGVKGRG
ncbi:hypothetical protein AAFF_G00067750 [Aldrovandia affinis]|uniref:Uncharacterized protein n=1 Tax=Aldrovandia affinis TaxID=143900 RepID=A0AAD7RZ59_9TELE|nr:hypothetical protein AAFF_G00067750 [Aldrovandia affinis]